MMMMMMMMKVLFDVVGGWQVVLGTFGSMEGTKDWVQHKLDQRIRSDMLSTVQACLTSINQQKTLYRTRWRQEHHRDRHARASRILHGSIFSGGGGGHQRDQSSISSIDSLRSDLTPISRVSCHGLLHSPDPSVRISWTSAGTNFPSPFPAVDLSTIDERKEVKGEKRRSRSPFDFQSKADESVVGAAANSNHVSVGRASAWGTRPQSLQSREAVHSLIRVPPR